MTQQNSRRKLLLINIQLFKLLKEGLFSMEKKNINWSELGFGYVPTDKRFVANYKNGAWDDGILTSDANVTISECAGVLQYAQTCFEGMKAYTTEDGRIVTFRPDLNAERMEASCKRLEMPVFPKERFGADHCSKYRLRSALWFRRHALHPPLHVRKRSRHRSKTGK